MSSKDKSGLNYGYVVMVASFLVMMVSVMGMGIYSVFFKPMSEEFGWGPSGVFWATLVAELALTTLGIWIFRTGTWKQHEA